MKHSRRLICFLLSFVMFSQMELLAQQPSPNDSLLNILERQLDTTYATYQKYAKVFGTWEDLSTKISSTRTDIDELKDAYSRNEAAVAFYSNFFVQYIEALKSADKAIKSLDKTNVQTKLWTVDNIVSFVQDDLSAKLTFALGNDGSRLLILDKEEIEVTVKAVDENGNEISGCRVTASPPIITPSSRVVEFNPTNNATRSIKPGKYVFKVIKGNKSGSRTEVVNRFLTTPIIIQL